MLFTLFILLFHLISYHIFNPLTHPLPRGNYLITIGLLCLFGLFFYLQNFICEYCVTYRDSTDPTRNRKPRCHIRKEREWLIWMQIDFHEINFKRQYTSKGNYYNSTMGLTLNDISSNVILYTGCNLLLP